MYSWKYDFGFPGMVIPWGLDSMTSQVGKPPLLVSRASTFSPQLVHVAHSPSLFQLCLRPLSLGMFGSHPLICGKASAEYVPLYSLNTITDAPKNI